MSHEILGTALWATLLLGVWFLAQHYWRAKAIDCAEQWARERHLSNADWSGCTFRMHRQRPSITFVAVDSNAKAVDVKLRFRVPVFGGWQVDEVAYCLPKNVCEDDALPLRG